jgi:hypothetical protein
VRGRIFILPSLKELEELLRTTFLEQAHEGACNSLHLRAGNLRDFAITVHEGAGDLLELKVTSDISVNEDIRELSRGNDKLGNQVHGIIAITA